MYVGVDEVGRGALAGPLCVAAVMAEKQNVTQLQLIKDSKQLTPVSRQKWLKVIKDLRTEGKLKYASCFITNVVIDEIGMTKAAKQAVKILTKRLKVTENDLILCDAGLFAPSRFTQTSLIKGDEKESLIAAASIVAKERRDSYMRKLHTKCQAYNFIQNVGYGTKAHRVAIRKYGLTDWHRKSWKITTL